MKKESLQKGHNKVLIRQLYRDSLPRFTDIIKFWYGIYHIAKIIMALWAGDHMVQKPPYWWANGALGQLKNNDVI